MPRTSILALLALPFVFTTACGEEAEDIFSPNGAAGRAGATGAAGAVQVGTGGSSGGTSTGGMSTGGTNLAGNGGDETGAAAGMPTGGASGSAGSSGESAGGTANEAGSGGTPQGGTEGGGAGGQSGTAGSSGMNAGGHGGLVTGGSAGDTGEGGDGANSGSAGSDAIGGESGVGGAAGSEQGGAFSGGNAGDSGAGGSGGTPSIISCERLKGSVVINEIQTDGSYDFVEFRNLAEHAQDISGWYFLDDDDDHRYTFESGTTLNDLIVVYKPAPSSEELSFDFGLGSGDELRLYNAEGEKLMHCSWSKHLASASRCPTHSETHWEHFETATIATPGAHNSCP